MADDRQAQAGAYFTGGAGSIDLVETFEDAFLFFLADADTGVGDFQVKEGFLWHRGRCFPYVDADLAARIGKFDGIIHQIIQAESQQIGADLNKITFAVNHALPSEVFIPEFFFKTVFQIGQQLSQADLFLLEAGHAQFDAREVEQIFDHGLNASTVFVDQLDERVRHLRRNLPSCA